MAIRRHDNPDLFDRLHERNLLRQYDLLVSCVDIGLRRGIDAFDKYMLWALNAAAVANIAQFGGRFREEPIYVGNHIPPHFAQVPSLMDQFLSAIHENWAIQAEIAPMNLPAYALWRLNWIHPFIEGNGRTARAACYYLICQRLGGMLPGRKSVPERIRENRAPYYAALQVADRHWADGNLNVDDLAAYLEQLVIDQLIDAQEEVPEPVEKHEEVPRMLLPASDGEADPELSGQS